MARTFYFSANRTSPLPKTAIRRMFVSSLLLCVGIGEGAQACAVFYPQEARAQRPYDRIVAATIIQAAYTGPREPHSEPWEATAKVISNAHGVPKDRIFKLYRTGSHGGGDCDDGEPLPKIGQTWILYLNRNARQQYPDYPTYSLPFAKARKMDPRFGAP